MRNKTRLFSYLSLPVKALIAFSLVLQVSCQTTTKSEEKKYCSNTYYLSKEEVLLKLNLTEEDYTDKLKIVAGIRYGAPCDKQSSIELAKKASPEMEGWRVVEVWDKPELILNQFCRSDFSQFSGVDEQWITPQYTTEKIYVALLDSESKKCLDIELENYIKADTGIPDSEVLLVLLSIDKIKEDFAASLSEPTENVRVESLSSSRGRDNINYYMIEVYQEDRQRPFRLLLEKTQDEKLVTKFINR